MKTSITKGGGLSSYRLGRFHSCRSSDKTSVSLSTMLNCCSIISCRFQQSNGKPERSIRRREPGIIWQTTSTNRIQADGDGQNAVSNSIMLSCRSPIARLWCKTCGHLYYSLFFPNLRQQYLTLHLGFQCSFSTIGLLGAKMPECRKSVKSF